MSSLTDHQHGDSRPSDSDQNRLPPRHPVVNNSDSFLIPVVVFVPIACVILLCFVTFFIYQCRKRRTPQASSHASLTIPDQADFSLPPYPRHNVPNTAIKEESPPAYSIISETRKDPHPSTHEDQQIDTRTETIITPVPHRPDAIDLVA